MSANVLPGTLYTSYDDYMTAVDVVVKFKILRFISVVVLLVGSLVQFFLNILLIYLFILILNHYAPVSQAN